MSAIYNSINLQKFILALTEMIFLSMFLSCSSDSLSLEESEMKETNVALNKLCEQWFTSRENVRQAMKGMTETASDAEYLEFVNKNGTVTYSYTFSNDCLIASVALVKLNESTNVANILDNLNVKESNYLGDVEGYRVYCEGNTFTTTSERTDNDVKYMSIGKTPVEGQQYIDDVEPIELEIQEPTNVTSTSMTFTVKISGTDEISTGYISYSTDPDMSDYEYTSKRASDNSYTITLSNLVRNQTYYVMAYVKLDDIMYCSPIKECQPAQVELYSIGDFYPNGSEPEGVVCRISSEGEHGTILSLDQSYLVWDTASLFATDYSAYNSSNGSKNDIGTTTPYAKWINGHGSGWYAPAKKELLISKTDLGIINKSLSSKGYTIMNGMYWSSTQRDNNTAYVVTVTETSYLGYKNQYTFYNSKSESRQVRAMKKF